MEIIDDSEQTVKEKRWLKVFYDDDHIMMSSVITF